MRRVVLVIGLLAAFYVLCALLGMKLPGGFVPDEDQGVVYALVQLPYGSSLDRNAGLVGRMEADLQKVHGVADVISLAGYNLLTSVQSPDSSSFIVVLKPWGDRVKEHLTLNGIVKDIGDKMAAYPQAATFPFVPPTIPGLGNASGLRLRAARRRRSYRQRARHRSRKGRRGGAQAARRSRPSTTRCAPPSRSCSSTSIARRLPCAAFRSTTCSSSFRRCSAGSSSATLPTSTGPGT